MAPQDTFLEDEEDTCPLCIEEFDLSDRGFRPCPCGYQICQFCFNNIKQNMNSLCPACRRPYDEKTIVWRVVTAEEHAEFKSNIQKNQKKRAAEQRQKEVQKREAERENRKNLVGVRVVQKNLVYVTGLNPTVREDELLKTLRKQEYFGQYGTIQKISISNRKSPDGSPSLGIYITFEKKEEAQCCILAVNGSVNDDRVLKAQLGTTKYCSAWLRHEQCTNRQCMFLHELGDEEDSYTRQDLSSMNSINTQRPLGTSSSSRSASRQQTRPIATPVVAAAQPMARSGSRDESENGDGSALPAAASWARNPQVRSRRGSHATSGAAPSPAISMSLPVTAESAIESSPTQREAVPAATGSRAQAKAVADAGASASSSASASSPASKSAATKSKKEKDTLVNIFNSILLAMEKCSLPSSFLSDGLALDSYPPLFDPRGGEKRRALRDDESRLDVEQDEAQIDAREPSEGEPESSGSLALGGEPEDREQTRSTHGFDQRRGGPPPPIQRANTDNLFGSLGSNYLPSGNPGTIGNRSITPQQSLYLRTPSGFDNHAPPGIAPSQSNLFQGQVHNRQPSRYGFANDNAGGSSTTIKLAANPRILAQQSSMMPQSLHSQQSSPYYAASMPGPPPGLKSTGTPPSGFGQGFANSAFGGAHKDSNQMLQDIIRSRGGGGAGSQAHDAGKRELNFPSFLSQYPSSSGSSTPAPAPGFSASVYGPPPGAFQDFGSKQKKKGKKHRHANTSSSGGSGLVDLADPGIAQARLPHQQSNAGSGQGLFGSQAQVDDELPALDDVVSTVDALVSDEPTMLSYPFGIDSPLRSGTPLFPPGFGPLLPQHNPAPTPPPGFSRSMTPVSVTTTMTTATTSTLSHVISRPPVPIVPSMDLLTKHQTSDQAQLEQHAALAAGPTQAQSATQQAKKVSRVASAATPLKGGKAAEVATPVLPSATPKESSTTPGTPLSKLGSKKNSFLQDEDFPALDAAAATPTRQVSGSVAGAHQSKALGSKPSTPVGKKMADKRPAPVGLNISAASKKVTAAEGSPAAAVASDKMAAGDLSAFPSLPTPSGGATTPAAPWSPAIKTVPKTLRVVQTPKTETAPSFPATGGPAPVLSLASMTAAESAKLAGAVPSLPSGLPMSASRQASAAMNRPGTPASEIVSVSDNASVVSASIPASRAGSPPPLSRIGSAAVRSTTKSQQRKQRKQASKKDSAAIAAAVTAGTLSLTNQSVAESLNEDDASTPTATTAGAADDGIAPILGRKKKQKKEKPAAAATTSSASVAATAAESRESTPAPSLPTGGASSSAASKKDAKDAKEKEAKEVKLSVAAKKKEEAKEKAAAAAASSETKSADKSKASKSGTAPTEAALVPAPLSVPAPSARDREEEALRKALREAIEVAGTTSLSVPPEHDKHKNGSSSTSASTSFMDDDDIHVLPGGTVKDVAEDMAARGLIGGSVASLPLLQPYIGLASAPATGPDADTSGLAAPRGKAIVGDALLPPEVIFTEDDRMDLLAGHVVRKVIDGVRLLVTPNGDCLRNLSEAEENRFLALQQSLVADATSPLSYLHDRYEATGGFALISKRAVPCGLPGYFPAAAKTAMTTGVSPEQMLAVDPVAKIQREEAVYWINQYVLPRLNLLPQSESASWQSMLADTGMPQAIGTSTVAPWIYHTPELRSSNNNSSNNNNNHRSSAPDAPTLDDYDRSGTPPIRDEDDLNNDLENSVRAMSVEDAARSLVQARREVETFERALNLLVNKNRRLLLGEGAGASGVGGAADASVRPSPVTYAF